MKFDEYSTALQIATTAHTGQKDKVGADYILHPLAVSALCHSPKAKIAALLHDVVEDTSLTIEDLRHQKIGEDCLAAIDCLTKRDGEQLEEYLARVSTSDIAIEVKLCDMLHNADISRFPVDFDRESSIRITDRYCNRIRMLIHIAAERLDSVPASVIELALNRIK